MKKKEYFPAIALVGGKLSDYIKSELDSADVSKKWESFREILN